MADLITSSFAQQALAAGGATLTAAQLAHLPSAITAASGAVRASCGGRHFTRATFDEVLPVGHDGTVGLAQIPVIRVARVASGRTPALVARNADRATNQRAWVEFAQQGEVGPDLAFTGLTLSRVASGVTSSATLAFATYSTLDGLAAAIAALGGGWAADVAAGFGAWASAELVALGASALPALDGASLEVWAEDLPARVDRPSGVVEVGRGLAGRPGRAARWDGWSSAARPVAPFGLVRVVYEAGYDVVPADVQEATAETVQGILARLATDPTVQSESGGSYSYTRAADDAVSALSQATRDALAGYRITRI